MSYDFDKIIPSFSFGGEFIHREQFGHGHINDTYAVYFKYINCPPVRYILQRINHNVFKDPVKLMENISGVTNHISGKIAPSERDAGRRVMRIIKTTEGQNYHVDPDGNYWRSYVFIDNAATYQNATLELFTQSGVAFGRFQNQLADYPAHTLHESIPNFHNTRARFEALEEAIARDSEGRASLVASEIAFALERKPDASVLVEMLLRGELPLRVTHNDTKLNNVMIDNDTGEGICVIDLDTVMPGLSLYDFGDSIRFGASTGDEDERDLSKISMSLELFEGFTKGYLSQARGSMTQAELDMLPFSARIMTFECGIRFLTDYLSGDTYFKTHREGHNLDRCRTQFKLVADMETKLDKMSEIVKKYSA